MMTNLNNQKIEKEMVKKTLKKTNELRPRDGGIKVIR